MDKEDAIYIHNGIPLSCKKKKKKKKKREREREIMPFTATWMDLEIIILSEVRKRKTNIMILLICGI